MRLIFFIQNTPNLTYTSGTEQKIQEKFSVAEIYALELVAIHCPDSNDNTCNRQSMC